VSRVLKRFLAVTMCINVCCGWSWVAGPLAAGWLSGTWSMASGCAQRCGGAADEAASYGQFKRVASEAVKVADMRVVMSEERRTGQSTLVKYLQLIGPVPDGSMFPNECRPYLAGVVGRGPQLKLLQRAGMLPLGRLESRKRRRGAASCPACGGPEEDAAHFVFTCGELLCGIACIHG
jgi:hypothetical protein